MLIENRDDALRLLLDDDTREDFWQTAVGQLDERPRSFAGFPLQRGDAEGFNRPNRSYLGAPRIALPAPEPEAGTVALATALMRRKSSLDFSGEPVSLATLATLLGLAAGETGTLLPSGAVRRAYPSGGALYGVEAHVLAQNVRGLEGGVYVYAARSHELVVLRREQVELAQCFADQSETVGRKLQTQQNASFAIVLTSYLRKAYVKYGDRAWKLALLEAGHIAQNVYLTCAALSLGVCGLGSSFDAATSRLLRIDRYGEKILYPLIVGNPELQQHAPSEAGKEG